ncbi:MAG: riboflavin synthase [Patescibacteria group bacterium]
MFTGIIQKTSKVEKVLQNKNGMYLEVLNNLGKLKIGESIAVNGVCSTVKKVSKKMVFEYMPETLKISNLGLLKKGDIVNLERSLRYGDSLDGHIVLGHIDCVGNIISIKKEGNSKVFEIKIQNNFKKFLAYKGSVTVEGISLTIAKVLKNSFIVKIIPYTIENTNLKFKNKGDKVNLEFDILVKYAKNK